jgi:hypothetical protein
MRRSIFATNEGGSFLRRAPKAVGREPSRVAQTLRAGGGSKAASRHRGTTRVGRASPKASSSSGTEVPYRLPHFVAFD